MPNNKQAKKRVRQDERRSIQNKVVRTSMRTAMKKVLRAETPEEAMASMPQAMKKIDKAAKNGIIHDNAAGRYKSRLARNVATKAS